MLQPVQYSLNVIREEARQLVCKGILDQKQPIYRLCEYFSPHEWNSIERELEQNDFLLIDSILDLLGHKAWCED